MFLLVPLHKTGAERIFSPCRVQKLRLQMTAMHPLPRRPLFFMEAWRRKNESDSLRGSRGCWARMGSKLQLRLAISTSPLVRSGHGPDGSLGWKVWDVNAAIGSEEVLFNAEGLLIGVP